MLSRIARGLHDLGLRVERAQHVARILEVNHKMNLERAAIDTGNIWTAISESFECGMNHPTEADLYHEIVLSTTHPYSVMRCIGDARDEGRSMREHISEEMWLHLNHTHLELAGLSFDAILRMGRSEFNRRIEIFGSAFSGLADDTMICGESWAFLRIGKLTERAAMICRILGIRRKTLALAPATEGDPIDVHQWQTLLRSLSGYEPYRRAYDARIIPERVLEFILKRPDFPRSLTCTLSDLHQALERVAGGNAVQIRLLREVAELLEELRLIDTTALARSGSFDGELQRLHRRCIAISADLQLGYFTSLRPARVPITAAPGAGLVPQ